MPATDAAHVQFWVSNEWGAVTVIDRVDVGRWLESDAGRLEGGEGRLHAHRQTKGDGGRWREVKGDGGR